MVTHPAAASDSFSARPVLGSWATPIRMQHLSARQRTWVVRFSNETGLTARNPKPAGQEETLRARTDRTYSRVF